MSPRDWERNKDILTLCLSESENGKNNNFALTTSDDIYKWSAGQASLLSLRPHLHEDNVSWNQPFLNRLKKNKKKQNQNKSV